MRNILSIALLLSAMLIPALNATAQKADSIVLANLKVLDAFSEKPLGQAHVSVYEADSSTVLVDSMTSLGDAGFFAYGVPRRKSYAVKVTCPGYPLTWETVNVPNWVTIKYPVEKPVYIYEETKMLDEVSVKASRILMVVKGDTVEYNAAAFRMSQGSMLDNLVRALPGAKINDDGQIYLNGEFVSSLLVNGKDFFNGDPKVALHNLPAYTVSKIKAYHKSDKAKITGRAMTEEEKQKSPLVMDVNLKREYAQGWISNFEAGGGHSLAGDAEGLWLARMFAMRYTNHSSIAFYAGSNNLNDAMAVGGKGEWKKTDEAAGRTKTHMAGFNLTIDPKDTKLDFATSLRAQQQRPLGIIEENGEDNYSSITTYHNGQTRNHAVNTTVDWEGKLNWSPRSFFLKFAPKISYLHGKTDIGSTTTKSQTAGAMGIDSLYRRSIDTHEHKREWRLGAAALGFASLPAGDQMADYNFSIDYRNSRLTQTVGDDISYFRMPEDNVSELRNLSRPLKDYTIKASLFYQNNSVVKKNRSKLQLFLNYAYEQRFSSSHQDLHRRDGDALTPSADNALLWWTDPLNSYHTTTMSRLHTIDPYLRLQTGDFSLMLSGAMHGYNRWIHDLRDSKTQAETSNAFTFDPNMNIGWNRGAHSVSLGGEISHELPEMAWLLDVTDGTDPLIRQRGNSGLKNTLRYSASAVYRATLKHPTQIVSAHVNIDSWHNRVSMAQLYDATTGITTFMPFNINGNRQLSARANYELTFGRSGAWSLGNELGMRLARSVDFSSDSRQQELTAQTVRNTIVQDELRLDYRIGNIHAGAKAVVNYTRQKSEQHFFETLHYTNQAYGVTFSSPILWGIDFDTDFMAYRRTGYDDPSMNTTDCVWNASLMRSFGSRKQWTLKAMAFDILHELSNIRREINAQGHTETRYNTLPSYATLSIVYRLDVKPAKKTEK